MKKFLLLQTLGLFGKSLAGIAAVVFFGISSPGLAQTLTWWGNEYMLGSAGTVSVTPSNTLWSTFTASSAEEVTGARLNANSVTNSPTLSVELYAVDGDGKPTGSALASGTVSPAGTGWTSVAFSSNYTLTKGNVYALSVSTATTGASFGWRYNAAAPATSLDMQPVGVADAHWARGANMGNPASINQTVWILETTSGSSIGQPYGTATTTSVVSATTTTGQRFVFDKAAAGGNDKLEKVTLYLNIGGTPPSDLVNLRVIDSLGDVVGTASLDLSSAGTGANFYTFDLNSPISLTDNAVYYLGVYSNGTGTALWYGWNVTNEAAYRAASFQGDDAYAVSWASQSDYSTTPTSTLTRDLYFSLGLIPEPTSLMLAGTALLMAIMQRRRNGRSATLH